MSALASVVNSGLKALVMTPKEVQIVICGAGPARDVKRLIEQALTKGWAVQPMATPAALRYGLVDVKSIEEQTGRLVVSEFGQPGVRRLANADAIIVAPATVNTITKLAVGIADTYAAAHLNDAVGAKIPMVILPSLKERNTQRITFKKHVEALRAEGVRVLLGEGGVEPTNASSKDGPLPPFPWHLAISALEESFLAQKSAL